MSAHSRLAPSSAYRWVECPLSVTLSEQFPALFQDPAGPEGTAAHWVWLEMLYQRPVKVGQIVHTEGRLPVTVEMVDGAQMFVDRVYSIATPFNAMHKVRLEQRGSMTGLHPLMFGTPDAEIDLLEFNGEYHIVDYKYGHRAVDPRKCWQLICYAYGALVERLKLSGALLEGAKVVFHIVQPRCFHGRPASDRWETTGKDLQVLWAQLRSAAKRAIPTGIEPADRRGKVGPHCRDCPGRRACPTLATNVGGDVDWVDARQPCRLSTAEAGVELSYVEAAIERMKGLAEGLKQQIEFEISGGGFSPHYALEQKPGRGREWSVDTDDVFAFGDLLEVDLRKPIEPITPSQAMQVLKKKGFDESLIAEYSVPKKGAMALVPKTDTLASRVFGVNKDGMA